MKSVSLRRRLLLLVAAGIAPVALVSGLALLYFYDQQREQAQRGGVEITRALATAVDAELRRTIAVLEVLATSPLLDTDDLAAFQGRAQHWLPTQPQWRTVILAAPDGTPLVNTRYASAPLPALAEMESFERAVRERRPVVGNLAQGARREWAIAVRVPVERAGKLRYVLTAVISPEAFIEIVQRQRVPRDWVVSVFDAKDQRLARSREQQFLAAQPSPTFKEMLAKGGNEGTGVTRTLENEPVYTAFTRLSDPPWTVAIGIPTSVVEAGAWRSLLVFGTGVLLSIALGLFAAFRLARGVNEPMAKLRGAAGALGRGESIEPVATDVVEIREVSDALAASSERRRRHEWEREELLRREQSARAFAEAANKSKDEFLAMLGHELRNPLGAISNAAGLLQDARAPEETRTQARQIIVRQVGHLTRLTDDLLDAARALRGKIVLEETPLDLAALVAQALRTLRAAGRLRRHRVIEDLQPVWVNADPIRIDQVVANLVVNAAKFTPPDGEIRVSVSQQGDDAVVEVADTGVGLSAELAPRVWDLFVQGESDLDRSLGGLGIGLTLVRRLSEMHGGSVAVESEGRGKGSRFTVRLPAIERPPVAAAPAGEAAEIPPRDVVIVEANDDARETLQMLLQLAGHRVHAEADGEAGLERALAVKPDIMLVDIGLPKMDGYEVARRMRAADGTRPYMIAITGYGTPEDRERALEAGFDAHVVKPVDFEALTQVLRQRP